MPWYAWLIVITIVALTFAAVFYIASVKVEPYENEHDHHKIKDNE
jgi:hypothetical protein